VVTRMRIVGTRGFSLRKPAVGNLSCQGREAPQLTRGEQGTGKKA